MNSLVRSAVKLAAASVDVVARPPSGVVVLCYHQVGAPQPGEVNLPTDAFRRQMETLAERGAIVSLDDALDALALGPGPEDARRTPDPIVITFDDGTADFVDHAVPILVENGLPATLYVATDFVERGASFWDDGTVLSWDALRDVVGTGLVGIGSHTDTHALLDRLDAEAVADELDRSIGRLEDRLGLTPRHFAYPKAVAGSVAADTAVRHRFRSAALAGGRPNRYGDTDPWRLARTPIQVSDGRRWFERKIRGGLRVEGALRERANRRRYAGATR